MLLLLFLVILVFFLMVLVRLFNFFFCFSGGGEGIFASRLLLVNFVDVFFRIVFFFCRLCLGELVGNFWFCFVCVVFCFLFVWFLFVLFFPQWPRLSIEANEVSPGHIAVVFPYLLPFAFANADNLVLGT